MGGGGGLRTGGGDGRGVGKIAVGGGIVEGGGETGIKGLSGGEGKVSFSGVAGVVVTPRSAWHFTPGSPVVPGGQLHTGR